MTTSTALAVGTVAVGTLDIADAFIFFGFRGVGPVRILQSIAAGLLGRESFNGGASTAALGALLHYFIAFCIVATFLFASRRLTALARSPFVWGPIYGVAVWLFMNFVVLPLSAAGASSRAWPIVINGLLIHMLGV